MHLAIKTDIINCYFTSALDHLYPTSESGIIVLFRTPPSNYRNRPKIKLKTFVKLTRTVTIFVDNGIVAMYHNVSPTKPLESLYDQVLNDIEICISTLLITLRLALVR